MIIRKIKAFSVVEFLIASLLTVSVVSGTTLAISISNDLANKNLVLDHVNSSANSIFQLSRVLKCGAAESSYFTAIESKCLNNPTSPKAFSGAADFVWPDTVVRYHGSLGFQAHMYTVWQQSTPPVRTNSGDPCQIAPQDENVSNLDAYQPGKITRILILEYTLRGVDYFSQFSDTQSLENSSFYNSIGKGAVVVSRAPQNMNVLISGNSYKNTSSNLPSYTRIYYTTSLTSGKIFSTVLDKNGCGWIPFIPINTNINLYNDASASTPANIPSIRITKPGEVQVG